jgi:hypothetical protein
MRDSSPVGLPALALPLHPSNPATVTSPMRPSTTSRSMEIASLLPELGEPTICSHSGSPSSTLVAATASVAQIGSLSRIAC